MSGLPRPSEVLPPGLTLTSVLSRDTGALVDPVVLPPGQALYPPRVRPQPVLLRPWGSVQGGGKGTPESLAE